MHDLFEESERLVVELLQLIDLPTIDSERVQISATACSLALEHWHAVRSLLELGLLPSALVVHRSQFEALTRSVWLAYAVRDTDLAKLTSALSLESEQAAKNIPTVNVMMEHIQEKAPAAASASALRRAIFVASLCSQHREAPRSASNTQADFPPSTIALGLVRRVAAPASAHAAHSHSREVETSTTAISNAGR